MYSTSQPNGKQMSLISVIGKARFRYFNFVFCVYEGCGLLHSPLVSIRLKVRVKLRNDSGISCHFLRRWSGGMVNVDTSHYGTKHVHPKWVPLPWGCSNHRWQCFHTSIDQIRGHRAARQQHYSRTTHTWLFALAGAQLIVQELMSERSIQLRTQPAIADASISMNSTDSSILPHGLSQAEKNTVHKPRFAEFTCSQDQVNGLNYSRCSRITDYLRRFIVMPYW